MVYSEVRVRPFYRGNWQGAGGYKIYLKPPPSIGNPYSGYINPYYWVDDHPLVEGNNGCIHASIYHLGYQAADLVNPPRQSDAICTAANCNLKDLEFSCSSINTSRVPIGHESKSLEE